MSDADYTEGEPTFEDSIRRMVEEGRERGFGDLPAKVLSYDQATQTVDVQPLVLVPVGGQLRPAPICRQVQVRWLGGATWSITGPLVAGDFGWLRPAGADISRWKMQGVEQSAEATLRRDSLSDAVFEPGSRPIVVPLPSTAYDTTAVVIAAVMLLLGDSTATDFVALASKVESELTAIKTAIEAPHTHVGVTPGTGSSGNGSIAGYTVGSVGATKVKAK